MNKQRERERKLGYCRFGFRDEKREEWKGRKKEVTKEERRKMERESEKIEEERMRDQYNF